MTYVIALGIAYVAWSIYRKSRNAYSLLFNDREGNSGRYGHWNGEKGYYDK